jgi:hypothetical protein
MGRDVQGPASSGRLFLFFLFFTTTRFMTLATADDDDDYFTTYDKNYVYMMDESNVTHSRSFQ